MATMSFISGTFVQFHNMDTSVSDANNVFDVLDRFYSRVRNGEFNVLWIPKEKGQRE